MEYPGNIHIIFKKSPSFYRCTGFEGVPTGFRGVPTGFRGVPTRYKDIPILLYDIPANKIN